MSRLNELILGLCPNGVEYKLLGEIATISRGGSLQKKDFVEALSFGFGDCPEFFNDEEYSGWPVVDLPVQKRPFIEIDGNYYCFDYYSFSDNFYRAIQKAVSRLDSGYNWSTVQQQASESMTAGIFKSLLPACSVYQNNYYPVNKSLKQMYENDFTSFWISNTKVYGKKGRQLL